MASFILPDAPTAWDRYQCAPIDNELDRLGSPLLTVPTPGKNNPQDGPSRRTSMASTIGNSSAGAQHVRVLVRVRPAPFDPRSCLEVDAHTDTVRIAPPPRSRRPSAASHAGRSNHPGPRADDAWPAQSVDAGCAHAGTHARPEPPCHAGTHTKRSPRRHSHAGWRCAAHTGCAHAGPCGADDARPHARPHARSHAGRRPTVVGCRAKELRLDGVCGPESTQGDVWDQARPLIDCALGGANATVFAYGQTGSGKTFTMTGTHDMPGVVPRSVDRIYETIDMSPEGTEWHMSLTYVELYNDGWRDLLAASSQPNQRLLPSEQAEVRREQAAINLRETKGAKGAVATSYLTGSTTFRTKITSKAQLLQLLERGNAARSVGSTNLNERSSRSHAVITLNLDSHTQAPDGNTISRTGKLHLVDLAGSEALTTGVESVLTAETRAINVSLTALCDVLQGARRMRAVRVAPSRSRCRTATTSSPASSQTLSAARRTPRMIAAVQTSSCHFRSTLTTLKFASRARDITTHAPAVDAGVAVDADMRALRAKVEDLQDRLRRREEEIERLESLQSAREAMATREHEKQLSAAQQMGAHDTSKLQSEIEELRTTSATERAELVYTVASLEAQILIANGRCRETMVELHVQAEDVAAAQARAQVAEASLALVSAQRDQIVAASESDQSTLEETAEAWRVDREQLAEAQGRIKQLQVQVEIAAANGKREDAANAQQLEREKAVAKLAAEHGAREMDAIRALLAVLDAGPDDGDGAERQLLWLKTKLREGLVRFDEAAHPEPPRSSSKRRGKSTPTAYEGEAPRSSKRNKSAAAMAPPAASAAANGGGGASPPPPMEEEEPPPPPMEEEEDTSPMEESVDYSLPTQAVAETSAKIA